MTPALRQLQAEVVALQAGALAESTRSKYSQYELYWVRFLLVFGLLSFLLNPSEAVVSFYVAFMARSVSYGTVKNYLQGLQRFLLDRGWPGHFSKFRGLQVALAGMRRASKAVTRKLPITPFILMRVLSVLQVGCARDVMVFAAMWIAFGAFLEGQCLCCQPQPVAHSALSFAG
jgi:hypothetical protein